MSSKSKITDMTVGSPSKHILIFALPLLIGNIFQQLYNMVDSVIVGRFVSADALAAVGTCGSLHFFCFALSGGLAIGIGIVVAQFFGAKNEKMVRLTIVNSFFLLTFASIFVSTLAFIFAPFILRLLNCPDSLLHNAIIYIRTTSFGIIFIALYNGIAAILRALGDSKTPLYFLILSSIVNLTLDLIFVLVFKLAVFGVAIATVFSQAICCITSIIYAFKKVSYFHFSKKDFKPNLKIIFTSLKIGVPVALQNCMISVSMMILQGVVNTFGNTVMATYTIVMRVEQLIQQPYGSLGAAITSYSGQNIGAGNIERVKKGMHRGTLFALVFSILILPIFFFLGKNIISFFVMNEEDVIEIGAKALKITSLCYFMLGMIYVPRAVLNGCGDTVFSMINGITEVICRIGLSLILTKISSIGFWGIWLTTGLTWTITAIVCLIRYKTGIWKKKVVV